MGLDFRLAFKCRNEKDFHTIIEGQGRAAFNFLREWVGHDRYGVDIRLSKEDIEELIDGAIKQEVTSEDYSSDTKFLDACVTNMRYIEDNIWGDPCPFVAALMIIQSRIEWEEKRVIPSKDCMDYYIECDW